MLGRPVLLSLLPLLGRCAANKSVVPENDATNVILICSLSIGTIVLAVVGLAIVLLIWKPRAASTSSLSCADIDAFAGVSDGPTVVDQVQLLEDMAFGLVDANGHDEPAFYLLEDMIGSSRGAYKLRPSAISDDVAVLASQRDLPTVS
ncbi:hypothetical protein SDRG_13452 [Saprolegnia diclina VS20]|uniref:Membrane-associated protein n=1 Tax=Saprolegnia diclina (strain VS20) TaxID=1156394 RepID=T0PTC2_SAPDV|nr:hypothetical protein SDRG_13452 [Saprolegnia diclina VS20]EQC28769.1 hypothetical protein SDRG_13452 [Saprolegnia diclina VS20]|eukprot:XP_008617764.1 hypothetical protein SDRG_13452 [Saprolegnia diclina VS20]